MDQDKNREKFTRFTEVRRKRIMKRLIFWGVVIIVIASAVVGFVQYAKWSNGTLPGVLYPELGRDHIKQGEPHEGYNSNPPSSGPHYETPAPWGIYSANDDGSDRLSDDQLIHNLEHGGVWISYRPGISPDIVKALNSFYQKYGSKVIVTSRAANDADIALVVWTRVEKFNVADYSEARVDTFIRRLRNKTGPEPFAQ